MKFFKLRTETNDTHKIISIGNLIIKCRKNGYAYILSNLYIDLILWFKRKKNSQKYKIIPMGTYCFARCITTSNKLKPKKTNGEKTCPFDLAFFNDIDSIIKLLDTKFANFYDDLEYDSENKKWINKKLNSIFIHDGKLSKEQFVEKYDARINNLYNYFADKNFHKYCLIATTFNITLEQINGLTLALSKYMGKTEFDIIIINQSIENIDCKKDNVFIINQNEFLENFNLIYKKYDWVRELKRRKLPEAKKIFNETSFELYDIINR